MKRIILTALMSAAIAGPAFAANNGSIDQQKQQAQNQYKTQRDQENQSYQQAVNDAKSKYSGSQLSSQLKQMELEHTKKLQDMASDEKIQLQKLDAQKNNG